MSKHVSLRVPVRLGVIGLYVSVHAAKVDNMGLFRKTKSLESGSKNSITDIGLNFTNRAEFLADIPSDGAGIEIGPFANPLLHGPNVKYLDILPTEQLITRARELGMDQTKVPHISYISDINGFPYISERFDYALSSHSIEHQPDLIKHLNQVEDILLPGGRYFLIIPDKRYCFDHFLSESTIADVVGAFLEKRTLHSAKSVIEHRALTTHNDPVEHHLGNHGDISSGQHERIRSAMVEYLDSEGNYVDVHAWQFVPATFAGIIKHLNSLSLSSLSVADIWDTPTNDFEFMVVLQKN